MKQTMSLPKNFIEKIKRLIETSYQIAKTEFKLKNEGSYLGIFWYLLNPILTFILLFLIFKDRLGVNIPFYALYLLIGIVMFNFFQSSTLEATRVIRDYRYVIKSINFPKESLIISIILKNLFSHFFEIILVSIVMVFLKVEVDRIFYYPLAFLLLTLFSLGVSLFLSSLTVYFVDMENVWQFLVRLIWLATPIFYSVGGQIRLFYLNLLNPMYYYISLARGFMIDGQISNYIFWGAVIYSIIFLAIGWFLFNKLKNKFAELI